MKAMTRIWGRKINDLGFSSFVSILSQKMKVIKIDRSYPSSKTCSHCGEIKHDLDPKDRVFICEHCGISTDAT